MEQSRIQGLSDMSLSTISSMLRVSLVIISSIFLILTMVATQSSGIFLDYLHILIVALAGFWFGLKGGILTAVATSIIFTLEATAFGRLIFVDTSFEATISRFSLYLFTGIGFGYLSDREKLLKMQLQVLAEHDELTGCFNYRYTMQLLEKEIVRARRYGHNLAVAMIDLDYFKTINDTYGHLIGNEVLKVIGKIFRDNLRNVDILGRYGGDEFLAIFPEVDAQLASIAIKRISGVLSTTKTDSLPAKEELRFPLGFCTGIASFPMNGDSTEALLNMADYAVYKAKQQGRGAIVIEKRKWKRFTPQPQLQIELVTAHKRVILPLKIIDISRTGVRLLVNEPLDRQELSGTICFSEDDHCTNIKCGVKYAIELGNNIWQVGIYFIDIDEAVQEKLQKFVIHTIDSQEA